VLAVGGHRFGSSCVKTDRRAQSNRAFFINDTRMAKRIKVDSTAAAPARSPFRIPDVLLCQCTSQFLDLRGTAMLEQTCRYFSERLRSGKYWSDTFDDREFPKYSRDAHSLLLRLVAVQDWVPRHVRLKEVWDRSLTSGATPTFKRQVARILDRMSQSPLQSVTLDLFYCPAFAHAGIIAMLRQRLPTLVTLHLDLNGRAGLAIRGFCADVERLLCAAPDELPLQHLALRWWRQGVDGLVGPDMAQRLAHLESLVAPASFIFDVRRACPRLVRLHIDTVRQDLSPAQLQNLRAPALQEVAMSGIDADIDILRLLPDFANAFPTVAVVRLDLRAVNATTSHGVVEWFCGDTRRSWPCLRQLHLCGHHLASPEALLPLLRLRLPVLGLPANAVAWVQALRTMASDRSMSALVSQANVRVAEV
jgi:hypothetical protein